MDARLRSMIEMNKMKDEIQVIELDDGSKMTVTKRENTLWLIAGLLADVTNMGVDEAHDGVMAIIHVKGNRKGKKLLVSSKQSEVET